MFQPSSELTLAQREREDGQEEKPLEFHVVITTVRYWWKIALPLAVLLAAGACLAVVYISRPNYTASAWLIIREKPEYLLNPHMMEDPRKFVQNQMELLRSPPVLDPVASKPEVFATPELVGGDPVERLRRLLKIHAKGQSDFFVIEFTSQEPKKAALVVNEVAKAYLLLQDRDLSRRMEATISQLEKQRADQQQLIERLRDQVQEKTKALTGVDPFAAKSQLAAPATSGPINPLQAQLVTAEIDQAMTAAQVEAEEELLAKQVVEVPAAEVESRLQSLPEIVDLRRSIAGCLPLLREHERTAVNLQSNQAYQQLLRQKSADERRLEQRLNELRSQVKTELEQIVRQGRADELASMRRSLEAKRLAVQILRERINKERAQQQVYKGETVELEFLRSDYDSAARVFEAINDRVVAMRLEQHAPDRVMLFKEALPPSFADQALPYKRMGLAAGLAALVPFGLALGYELWQRRVSSRRQLEAMCHLPVVAEVTSMPRLLPGRSAAERGLINRELQMFEECIDGLRTHLLLTSGAARCIAVTSAISREGKTSVAVQLALSIARSGDEPTLLIDADLRCPDIHRIFEIERSPGLAELLQGGCSYDDAIVRGFSPSLHLITAGKLASVPHRALRGAALARLINELGSRYSHIVIDTPPLLAASEALLIARAADAAVVCARRDFSRLDQVIEAHNRLQAAGARVAGTVLNGISPHTYAYRYGSYYYPRGLEEEPAAAVAAARPARR
jgi:capsular exopolysaccharide synthesis family protein